LAPYNNKAGYAHFNESGWNSYAQITSKQLPVLYASTQSKSDQSFWFTSNQGLVHIANNTTLETIQPNANTGAYKTIQSDKNNLIWVVQENQGLVRQSNNAWTNIPVPSNLLKSGLDQFIINNNQQAWMIAPNSQGIYVYQSKDVFSNEIWVQLVTQAGHGNLPSNHVTSLAVDKTGSIWVGTDNGIGIFNCGDVSNEPCNAYLPIVNNNGFNGYLFQKEIVNCIAIDGANRKWIGTHNGAWLLSSDGLEIIEHFTSLTSPLPTDTITQITIAPNSGEVFFNTTKQMVSYRGTATKSVTTQNAIDIYPNPVGPNFAGPIAFRGLVENAVVKITDLTGRLLYQTKALGGQAVWNGRTYEGKKVATGIYLVFVRDLAGNEKGVGKIVIADGY
jgi:ligand-binding sensor domain-containing protein